MTALYLTTAAADAAVTAGSGTKWKAGFAPGTSSTHLNKNSVAGPTAPLQMTDGATAGTDGTAVSWYTAPLWGVTIAGAISCLFWDRENATANNIAPSMRIERCDGSGNVLSVIVDETVNHGSSEMGTTAGGASDALNASAANVTDTTLSDGDRLRITLWIDDAAGQGGTGNMASGGRGEFWVNGPNGAAGQSQLIFTEIVAPQAGPKIFPFETANWTATTTPRAISAIGALSADLIVAMYGGDNFGGQVTAAAASTTGGTTGAWTEVLENFGPSSNSAWKSNAWADVTADGDVTVSLARTQGSPQVWGGWAALLRNHGGIGNTAELTNGATETVSLTTSENSIVVALGIDWDDLTNVAFLPAGAHDVERVSGTAVAWYAGFWVGQAAGTRNYGIATSSTANFVITLIEILAPTGAGMALGAATETDTALLLASSKASALSPAAETDAARQAALSKVPPLAQGTETDAAQVMSLAAGQTYSRAMETDTAQLVGLAKATSFGTATEVGTPHALSNGKGLQVGASAEGDTAQTAGFAKALAFGTATETDAAHELNAGSSTPLDLGTATETDTARASGFAKTLVFGTATETDAARLANLTGSGMPLGSGTETGTARPMTFAKAKALASAMETDVVQTLLSVKGWTLGTATESSTARLLDSNGLLALNPALETDTALPMSLEGEYLLLDTVFELGVAHPMILVAFPPGSENLDNWLTLGDLMDARATHELIMIDQISVRHPGMIEGVFDPDLGYAPATPRDPYYAGKATVQARQISAGQLSPAGLGTLTQLGYAVHGPVGTTIDQAAPDDVIMVTDSADPRYVGLMLIVRNVESSSFVTARRLVCTVYESSTP